MLTITVQSQQVSAALERIAARVRNLRPAMQGIGQELESRVSARFEAQADPDGIAWAPWKDSTRAGYPFPGTQAAAQQGGPGNARLLDRSGDLLASLNHSADATSARVGFGQDYAVYHEWGTRHMSRRGLLLADPDAGTLSPGDSDAVLEILGDYLAGL